MSSDRKPVNIDAVNVDDEKEFDDFMNKVIAEGDKRLHAQVQEAIRLGIIDEHGNLLKHDLPEDMREDAERDFGG
jgi:hypothetical protein